VRFVVDLPAHGVRIGNEHPVALPLSAGIAVTAVSSEAGGARRRHPVQ
jgi:hypothetical protein